MLIDKSLSIKDGLLLHKNIEPMHVKYIEELREIEGLDVTEFSEADVRAEIIDPIVRALGYKKSQFSSVNREKHISFLGKTSKYIDYAFTLWKENFWLIEAKKPLKGECFGYKELSQATEYSIHPEINAAVIVLCDGLKIEVFDREEDLEKPVLAFKIKELVNNFDSLRMILEPMQIWFFYKRRVIKSIDKAFEIEFNIQRVNEFKVLVENRLSKKRDVILKNYQATNFMDKDRSSRLKQASVDDIIDGYFYFMQSRPDLNVMNEVLVDSCIRGNDFLVINKMFPEDFKSANDAFYSNALSFLIQLERSTKKINYTPSWLSLGGNGDVESLIHGLIRHSLNYFDGDEVRKTILLASSAFRRLYKILAVIAPSFNNNSELRHLLTRYTESEFSWEQILSSPKRNVLSDIEIYSIISTDRFVKSFTAGQRKFNVGLARQNLKELWSLEIKLLKETNNYTQLLREMDFGELNPTECSSVAYDNLGHTCLCIIKSHEKWRAYILKNYQAEIFNLAGYGSWAAKELIESEALSDNNVSNKIEPFNRFFFGDEGVHRTLSTLYGLR
ncbi:type I restriction enzyme HsdR N-terminal domain-containing protein [Raoultella ornithinolytica]|nr:type I restriction enzyme HsdR N-terminal domain-containing protein [Raoultella ornithinolytica]